jgi:hypothetical protein
MGRGLEIDDDIIIQSSCTNHPILNQFLGKCDLYGEPKYFDIMGDANSVGDKAKTLGLDRLVARGIYTGIGVASPTYEEIGEQFLRDVLPDYTKGTYGSDLIRAMLKGLSSERLEKICQGVKDILDYGDSEIKEAKLAALINECYRWTDSFEDRDMALITSQEAIHFLIKYIADTGKYVMEESIKERLKSENDDPETKHRQKNVWKAECRSVLDFAFEYFMNHTNEIPEEFLGFFQGMDKRKVVAYYVTTRPDTGLLEFFEKKKNSPSDICRGEE